MYETYFQKDESALLLFEKGVLIAANESAEEFLGVNSNQLLGLTLSTLFPSSELAENASIQTIRLPNGLQQSVVSRSILLDDEHAIIRIRQPLSTDLTLAKEERQADIQQLRESSEHMHDVFVRLAACKSLDELYRCAVIEGRKTLGLERLAILLVDHEAHEQRGTWGTDVEGNLTNEHSWHAPLENTPWLKKAMQDPRFCHYWEDVDLLNWGKVVGRGWSAMANLWDGEVLLGWLTVDNLLEQKPLTPTVQQIFRLFALNLGQLVLRKQTEIELRELNELLEARVEEKTRNLNEQLERMSLMQRQMIEQEKNASLGNLVAGVAHEINTPLGNSLVALSQLRYVSDDLNKALALGTLTKTQLTNSVNEIKESTTLLESNLHRSVELIRSFKQLATDQSDDQIASINLYDLISNVLNSFNNQYKNRPLDCYNNVDPDTRFLSSPAKITQIVTNLLDNGLRHGFPEGTKRKGKIVFSASLEASTLKLQYADNGVGIDSQFIQKIFEPMQTSNRTESMGLGLTIIHQIVTAELKGNIHCSNIDPFGVRFEISFPVTKKA